MEASEQSSSLQGSPDVGFGSGVVEGPTAENDAPHPRDRRDIDADDRAETPGGIDPEPVEERPNVGVVEPDDYPEQQ